MGRRKLNEYFAFRSLLLARASHVGSTGRIFCRRLHLRDNCAASAARLCAAALSRRRLYLDTWLLGLRPRRLLLGARNLGPAAGSGLPVDPRLLGLGRRCLFMARGLLGSAHRLLWWNQLWIRLLRFRLRWRILERSELLLQPECEQRSNHECSHLQQDCH